MSVSLTNEEAVLLERVLTQCLSDLRSEIHHTDSRPLRAALKRDAEALNEIVRRLATPVREPVPV
ncbi:MAG TPA: hypothetical protein VFX49_03400 [Chloroflexota bacterium]|nr:hypothetical protein [Chloroflexota bacterium]